MHEVISADSHVIEPHDLWLKRLPSKYRDRAPRLVSDPDTDRLFCPDVALQSVGFLVGCARKGEASRPEGRWEEILSAGYDPDARLDALKSDGVDAEVLFPTTGMLLYPIEDQDFQWALFRTYNTWMAEEFAGVHPDRYKGIAMLNPELIEESIVELRRAKSIGLAGVMVPLYAGEYCAYHDKRFDPLWQAAVDNEMPVNIHTATTRKRAKDWRELTPTDLILDTQQIQHVLLDMILSGLFDRFPALKVVSAENDVGWAGSMVERADYWYNRNRKLMRDTTIKCVRPPSEYFHENVRVTFMEDRTGILAREVIGTEVMMWGSDFPHHVSTWPDSQSVLDEQFAGQVLEDRTRITATNVRELYDFQ
jgi:predicted TIM-barrel fold metal-dependent hydrolase